MESLRHLFRRARLVWHLRQLELLANCMVEASVPTIILFCVIRENIDNLYKWQTFRPKGLHQSQILYADNNSTIIRDINRVFIDIFRSICSVINYVRGFVQLERRVLWTKDRGFLNSSLMAKGSSTSLSICSRWSSSRWYPYFQHLSMIMTIDDHDWWSWPAFFDNHGRRGWI